MNVKNSRKIILLSIIVLVGTFVLFAGISMVSMVMIPSTNIQSSSVDNKTADKIIQPNEDHVHAALMVFVNEKAIDFSGARYQSQDLLSHFEDGNGVILHNHSRRAWLGVFLQSLNVTLAKNCLTLDNGSSYCSNFDNQISFMVNGRQNPYFQHYVPKDGDRILIIYGKPEQIKSQLDILNSAAKTRT